MLGGGGTMTPSTSRDSFANGQAEQGKEEADLDLWLLPEAHEHET